VITEVMAYTIELLFLRDSDTFLLPGARGNLPNFGPKPQVHPFGPGYDLHPELSRSGLAVILSRLAPPVAIATTYAASMYVEQAAIKNIVASENIDTNTKIRFLSGY
jgi:hypothetical protein